MPPVYRGLFLYQLRYKRAVQPTGYEPLKRRSSLVWGIKTQNEASQQKDFIKWVGRNFVQP